MSDFYRLVSRHRHLDKIAYVTEEGEAISYRDLFDNADRLGAALTDWLGDNNCAVGIYQYKTLAAVVGIFGVVAASKAFVPIDPKLPRERIAHVVRSASLSLVLAGHDISTEEVTFFANLGVRIVPCNFRDGRLHFIADLSRTLHGKALSDHKLSHVLFTSGTTGFPKGVMIKEESQVAFVQTMAKAFGHDVETRWLSVSPLYFDVCTLDLFVEMHCGSTVVLMRPNRAAHEIAEALEKFAITHVVLISSIVKMLASAYSGIESRDLSSLRELWYGGEACPIEALRKIKSLLPAIRFAQCYGPSEVCNNATLHRFDDIPADAQGFMPLGKTIDSVEGYIVDNAGKLLQGPGTGELCLGGVQVMAGYVNDPAATGKSLVENRFNPSSPYKLYRTGDYVRVDGGGLMHFHGRKDELVKVRGNRVSLHEVQSAIVSLPSVTDAIVFVKGNAIAGVLDALNAVVISDRDLKPGEVKSRLKHILPGYMIPDQIHVEANASVPIKENGKLDRSELLRKYGGQG